MKLILFEDDDLLVIHKPAGLNTHAPDLFAGEGIYEWLKNREPRWQQLAIIHRLDKETSGVMVFGKTVLANRSLTAQFTERRVAKKYVLLTDRAVNFQTLTVESVLSRAGEKYVSRPVFPGGEQAETRFKKLSPVKIHGQEFISIEATPMTGRTHQIRTHAASRGFPILGDVLYGGTPADRVCLHAMEISFSHPATNEKLVFFAPENFTENARYALRFSLIDGQDTNAFRLIHGAGDRERGWYVERLGDFLLSQSQNSLRVEQHAVLEALLKQIGARGVYHKILTRRMGRTSTAQAAPQFVSGEKAPNEFMVRENEIQFALSFNEGYSNGLFLDQRENRRRILTGYIAPDFFLKRSPENFSVLNTFAYTCGFSVCAAKSGATTTSLDLSKKYLEWGKKNFALNGLDAAKHDFIFGDAFDWMKRLAKQNRQFDLIILDPPTFSQSKERGAFRAEKDYGKLVAAALPLLKRLGILLASTNAADVVPKVFLETIQSAIQQGGRKMVQQHYAPQPPDFPVSREEPAYLKTVWLKIA
ncbi:MAG: class I SAM-dependent methyltransferase [Verrucomicrobiota bacterium]